jgi:lipoprotein-anchoring transpeptidase ErfK/SrfK
MRRKILVIGLISMAIALIVISIINQAKNESSNNKKEVNSEADGLYNFALSWQSKGQIDKAIKIYQEFIAKFPYDQRIAEAWYRLGKIYQKENLPLKAKDAYTEIITNFPNFKQISEVENNLWKLNIEILFSPIITETDIVYKVEPGDTLSKIAAKYNTTVDLIMQSNNLKDDLIRPGQRLKVSTAKYSVIVDKSQNTLTLKANDEIFKVYTVATGKFGCTPTGNFTIVEKLENPDWYKSGKGIISANDPENILGSRWLGLSEPQYGIHGGAATQDLNRQITNGCVRMMNDEVEELFTILARGTKVTIVD